MISLRSALFAAALLAGTPAAQAAPETFDIDPGHVYAGFTINHLGFSNMWGRFNDVQGSFVFDKDNVAASSIKVVIKTASIDTNHEKRDAHLSSPDFFNAVEFPELTFVSTGIEKTGEKTGRLTGDLTLLGVTKPVVLDVVFNNADIHPFDKKKPADQLRFVAGFSATGAIKRSDFGMDYGLPAIGDEITLQLEAEGLRK